MDILPVVSKYGFRKRNQNPIINKTLDVQISNLNRIGQRVNENVSVIDPIVYLKKVNGVELTKEDNLNVSTKNLIQVEYNNYSLWDFPNPSGTTLIDLNISFDNSETVQIDWGDGSVETINSDTNYSHTYS